MYQYNVISLKIARGNVDKLHILTGEKGNQSGLEAAKKKKKRLLYFINRSDCVDTASGAINNTEAVCLCTLVRVLTVLLTRLTCKFSFFYGSVLAVFDTLAPSVTALL